MKILRMMVLSLFVMTLGVYGFFHFYNKSHTDLSYPVISYTNDVLDVSVADEKEDLLYDVTAFDEKDGDLTDKIIIEKISNFVEKGISNITYAVIDHDNHVAKATRRIRYLDYKPPYFTFSQAMRFELGSDFNVLGIIGAKDMIDGDVTNKIKLTSSDLSVSLPGVYKMQAQVTNSKGDVRYLQFAVTMYEGTRNGPKIYLKDYLIYLSVGDAFDAASYVDQVMRGDTVLKGLTVTVDSDVNTAKAGNYQADYFVMDENGLTATTSLIVIVEE